MFERGGGEEFYSSGGTIIMAISQNAKNDQTGKGRVYEFENSKVEVDENCPK